METLNDAGPIVVRHDAGARFEIQIRDHRLIVDQTVRGGGENAGPEPIELLGAALGSCVAYYVDKFCRARSLSCDEMVITVEQQMADHPRRIARFSVHVSLPDSFPGKYVEAIERVVQGCPAYNTLVRGAEVGLRVDRVIPAMLVELRQ